MVFLVLLAFVASALTAGASETHPCRASLPRGPAVPATIILRTSCGGFRLAPDGEISRLPPHWFTARAGGTGRRYGADLRIERTRPGRIILLRRGRVVWRSRNLYRRDGGDVAFGPGAFAFASYRRGIFLTDLKGSERLIIRGVGLHPLAFLSGGELLVSTGGWGPSISVLSPEGLLLRRYRYRPRTGYAFDQRTETLFFVTPDRLLVRAQGTSARIVRRLGDLDGWISTTGRDWNSLVFLDGHQVTVIRPNGTLVARANWHGSGSRVLDSGIFASPDSGTFAFRLRKSKPRSRGGTAVVYVLRTGERQARAIYRHRLGDSGCAVGASLTWQGGTLLYSSSDGHLAVLDSRNGGALTLTDLAAALPGRGSGERATAYWASGFPQP